jgi:hypothetical protein
MLTDKILNWIASDADMATEGDLAELLRVYRLWKDALHVEVRECCGHSIIDSADGDDPDPAMALQGQWVRVVLDTKPAEGEV